MPQLLKQMSAPALSGDGVKPGLPRVRAANDVPSRLSRQRRDLVMRALSAGFGVSQRAMASAGRSEARAVLARQCGIYLMHVVFSIPLPAVAALFRKDRSTAAYACQRVEDLRDAPAFDAFLHDLELAVSALDSAIQLRTKHEHKDSFLQKADDFLQEEANAW